MRIRFDIFVALMLLAAALCGQATDGIIVGRATDATGSAVLNAKITATNKDTNVKYATVTNSAGEYRINNAPAGRYDVSASAPGFAVASVANVQLELNHTASVNVGLVIGPVNTSLEVQQASTAINIASSQLQTTYESRSALDQPTASTSKLANGSGIWNLSLLGAGVASSGGIGQGIGPSVGGQRPENNSFNIDGVSIDSFFLTGPLVYVSNEAISQFTLLQNQFSPEFGGASGGVFNIAVQSGGNQTHGSVFEYLQNRNLNAAGAPPFPRVRYDNNRLGATIGGPLIKDKLFYFGNFEYNPIGFAVIPKNFSTPTATGISILNSLAGLSKTNLEVFEKYVPVAPVPSDTITVAGVSVPVGPPVFSSPGYFDSYNGIASIDWNINSSGQLRGRYIQNKNTGIDTAAQLPVFYVSRPNDNHLISLSEFQNFSPTMQNELRISFSRNNNHTPAGDLKFPGLDVFPNVGIGDLFLQIGPNPAAPSGSIQNSFQIQENLTKSWGRHTLKAGYHFNDLIFTSYFIMKARGDYEYSQLDGFLRDLSPDFVGQRVLGAGNGVPLGSLRHSAYFNDDFRIRPNLTFNLGLRYEYVTVPVGLRTQKYSAIADVPGVISFKEPQSSPNDWSPRLGFAYSPRRNNLWSVRGGISRAFDNIYANLAGNAVPAYYQSAKTVSVNSTTSNFLGGGGATALPPILPSTPMQARAQITGYTWDQNRPYGLTGTVSVQRLFARDYAVEARYVYTKGVHLWVQDQINIVPKVTPTENIPTFLAMPTATQLASRPLTLGTLQAKSFNSFSQYGFDPINAVASFHPIGNSMYNGLALQLNKRFSRNFSFVAAYTWSHNLDDSTATVNFTILTPRRAQDSRNLSAEWASSALDRRHRLTFSPVYDFKLFQSRNWFVKNVVSNWNVSATYTYQSPEFATVQSGVDSNLNNDSASDRTIVNPSGTWNAGSGVTAYNAAGRIVKANSADIVAYVANNPNARYIVAERGAYATGGRNTFPLAPVNNVDAALVKRLAVSERRRLEVGAQFFNLLNHSQFVGGLVSDVSPNPTNGLDPSFLRPTSASFGKYDRFFSSNSRVIQAVARFIF